MPSYVTVAQVRSRCGGFLDQKAQIGSVVVTCIIDNDIQGYIDDNQEKADAQLASSGYTTPFNPVPRQVASIVRDLAAADSMDQVQARNQGAKNEMNTAARFRKDAQDSLKRLKAGIDRLIDPGTGKLLQPSVNSPFPVDEHPLDFHSADEDIPLACMLPFVVFSDLLDSDDDE